MARTRTSVVLKSTEKPWSPPARDPCFSRLTPDELLARIKARRMVNKVNDVSSWVHRIVAQKACKTPIHDPRRKKLLRRLASERGTRCGGRRDEAETPWSRSSGGTRLRYCLGTTVQGFNVHRVLVSRCRGRGSVSDCFM